MRLLGGFELRRADDVLVELPTLKSRLLLAYLALPAGQPHSRAKLASLFWGDTREEQARGSLRSAIAALRNGLGDGIIEADRSDVKLVAGAVEVDVEVLATLATRVTAETGGIDRLYGGELLDGIAFSSEEFDVWLSFERARCRNLAEACYERTIHALIDRGKAGEAIVLGERLIAMDVLREQSHRLLMRIYDTAGERPKAMAQFQRLKELLQNELGTAPSAQTASLAASILRNAQTDQSTPTFQIEPSAVVPGPVSIAVLPFASLAEGTDDHLIARGFSEDLITELSRLPELFVIAPQSSGQFPESVATVRASAVDLGVRYAVSGTYRRVGARLRITAQLMEASTNRCLWAERYDGDISDALTMQDDIVARIAGALDTEIRSAERERAASLKGEAFGAWELAHRGLWHIHRTTKADYELAEGWLKRAIAVAPDYAVPYAGLAHVAFSRAVWNWVDDLPSTVMAGIEHGKQAVVLDPRNAFAHCVLGRLLLLAGQVSAGIDCLRRAIALNPSLAYGYLGLGHALMWAGKPDEALQHLERAIRLSPKDPTMTSFLAFLAFCRFMLGDFAEAEAAARKSIEILPGQTWSRLALAAALAGAGRVHDARVAIAEARAFDPELTVGSVEQFLRHAPESYRQSLFAVLREAGL